MPQHRPQLMLWALLGFGALLLAPVTWQAALHCDELTVLRHVTNFAAGDVGRPGRPGLLWLVMAPLTWLADPVLIVRAARLLGLAAALGTLGLVARLASRQGEAQPGDAWAPPAAVALLLGAMAWHGHGWEVRTDSFTAPMTLLLGSQLWRDGVSLRRAALLGLLVGAMGLISQKSIYNVVAVSLGYGAFAMASPAGFALRERARVLGVIAGVALLCVGVWYAGMSVVSGRGAEFVSGNLALATRTGFGDDRAFAKKLGTLQGALRQGAPLWTLAGIGALMVLRRARRQPRMVALTVTALAMLSTIAFHRGVFLYYIASFEPLLAPVAAVPVAALLARVERSRPRAAWAAAAGLLVLLGGLGASRWTAFQQVSNHRQLDLMREVQQIVPEPAPYWDQIALVPGYPEATFFGTAGVRKRFRAANGSKAFIDRARERRPRFFLRDYMSRDRQFSGAERRWHWRHFLPYRDNLYLLGGRRLATAETAEVPTEIEVLVPGEYTVWFLGGWKGSASVDGEDVAHGEVIELTEGRVTLRARPNRGEGQLWVILGRDRAPAIERPQDHIDWSLFPIASRTRYQQYDRSDGRGELLTQPHDPTLVTSETGSRAARHRRFQQDRDRRHAVPRRRARR